MWLKDDFFHLTKFGYYHHQYLHLYHFFLNLEVNLLESFDCFSLSIPVISNQSSLKFGSKKEAINHVKSRKPKLSEFESLKAFII
ncbi:hypothetical protein BpHYR1_038810 [Brachionus plicatilis]|uniref:Uncharacterized protein n=1 Tax=Brachionus plicatilis TaxID=10195 RepID=A0A3M7QPQ5_BRAPC|nr:hypothetical protein BpHYR1_038810 [Brachionus plicatilis]